MDSTPTPARQVSAAHIVEFATGRRADDFTWNNQRLTVADLVADLSVIREGPKDGKCLLQGPVVNDGVRRLAKNQRRNETLIVDIDNGTSADELDEILTRLGHACIVWATHSHLKGESDIDEAALDRFKKAHALTDNVESARRFLSEAKGYRPHVVDSVRAVTRDFRAGGVKYVVTHAPLERLKVLFFLDAPFDFLTDDESQKDRIERWKRTYKKFARDVLGVVADEKCCDPSRLQYYPRRPQCSDAALYWVRYTPGTFLTLPDVEADEVRRAPSGARESVASGLARELGVAGDFQTPGLARFLATHGKSFQAATWLGSVTEVRRDVEEGKIECECPLDELHSNAGDPADKAFFAVDARPEEGKGWHMGCGHTTCSAHTGGDRAKYLDEACVKYGVQSADELRTFCLDDGGAAAAAAPLPERYGRDAASNITHTRSVRRGDEWHDVTETICGPLTLKAMCRDDEGMGWGRVFEFRDLDGTAHEVILFARDLEEKGFYTRFTDCGLTVSATLHARRAFRELMEVWTVPQRVTHVSRLGWHRDFNVYLPPMGAPIVREGYKLDDVIHWVDAPSTMNRDDPTGTVESFRTGIEGVHEAIPIVALGILHGLGGPGVGLLGLPNMGLFFAGDSTTGKSSGALAVAAMGSDVRTKNAGLIREARGTANAIESFARVCSGASCVVDDLENGATDLASDLIYMMSNGSTKLRLNANAGERPIFPIEGVTYAFSAERPPAELADLRRGGLRGGATARCPVASTTDQRPTDAATYARIMGAIRENCGVPLRAFVAHLINEDVRRYRAAYAAHLDALTKGLDGAQARAMQVLALAHTNGDYAKAWGILPPSFDVEGVIAWAAARVRGDEAFEALTSTGLISDVDDWIATHLTHAANLDDPRPRNTPAPFFFDESGVVYLPKAARAAIGKMMGKARSVVDKALISSGKLRAVARADGRKNYSHDKLPGRVPISHYRYEFATPDDMKAMADRMSEGDKAIRDLESLVAEQAA